MSTRLVTALACALTALGPFSQPTLAESVKPAETMTQQAAADVVSRVAAQVAEIRGLAFERDVPVAVIDDAQARTHLISRMELFDYENELEAIGRVYERLGALEPGVDLLEQFLVFFEEQAGGFYDPQGKAFYLLDDIQPAMVETFTAHELTHALEDQHYDLDRRLRAAFPDDDRLFALSAVHEGSATVLMTVYMTQAALNGELELEQMQAAAEIEAERSRRVADLPSMLLRQAIGPYVLGLHFLTRGNPMAAALGYPVEDARRAYEDGPRSSEQILHPEKFWDAALRDDPVPVELGEAGSALGRRYRRQATGVLGELGIGSLVGAGLPGDLADPAALEADAWTVPAAAGWGGDRWELWSRGERDIVLLSTLWDSERDAEEFERVLTARAPHLVVQRRARGVAVVAGVAGRRAGRVVRGMLDELAADGSSPVVAPRANR